MEAGNLFDGIQVLSIQGVNLYKSERNDEISTKLQCNKLSLSVIQLIYASLLSKLSFMVPSTTRDVLALWDYAALSMILSVLNTARHYAATIFMGHMYYQWDKTHPWHTGLRKYAVLHRDVVHGQNHGHWPNRNTKTCHLRGNAYFRATKNIT